MSDNKKESFIIKEMIENIMFERTYILMFLAEKGLTGDFTKWCKQKEVSNTKSMINSVDGDNDT